MQQVIKKYIDQLEAQYPLVERDTVANLHKINSDEIDNIVEQMVSEYSQNGIRHNFNISLSIKNSLDRLSIIYEILDECGYQIANHVENHDYKEPCKREALIRLRMLYLRALNEVIYLLEGGYASASFGRSRTFYEIGVYLEIVSENSEDIAKAFLDHSNYSRDELVKELNDSELKEKVRQSLLTINPDNNFWKSYQWAAPLLGYKKKITFYDLAHITSLSKYYRSYKASCQCVHATIIDCIKGIGLSEEEQGKSIWITGPSENGIDFNIKVILLFSNDIIQKYFELGPLNGSIIEMLIMSLIKNDDSLINFI